LAEQQKIADAFFKAVDAQDVQTRT